MIGVKKKNSRTLLQATYSYHLRIYKCIRANYTPICTLGCPTQLRGEREVDKLTWMKQQRLICTLNEAAFADVCVNMFLQKTLLYFCTGYIRILLNAYVTSQSMLQLLFILQVSHVYTPEMKHIYEKAQIISHRRLPVI